MRKHTVKVVCKINQKKNGKQCPISNENYLIMSYVIACIVVVLLIIIVPETHFQRNLT